jgi:hypothetical protein
MRITAGSLLFIYCIYSNSRTIIRNLHIKMYKPVGWEDLRNLWISKWARVVDNQY